MTVEIRLATVNEYPQVAAFIDLHWKKDHIYTRSKPLFDWTFRSPEWPEPAYSVSIALNEGRLIGMLGTIPFRLNVRGNSVKACWLVNWLVVPEARKGRTGLALLNLFASERGYGTISFGINDTIARLYAALRWQNMPPMPRMEWINPARSDAAESLLSMANPEATEEDIRGYIFRHAKAPHAPPASRVSALDAVGANAWDAGGWSNWSRKSIGCARDFAYLSWRYLRHPIYRYEIRVIEEGARLGLIAWRLEITRRAAADGMLEAYLPVARIVEFLPVSARNAQELISTSLTEATAAGAVAADFYCYHAELGQVLQQMGFAVSAESSETVCLPNFTQPIAQGRAIRSAIKIPAVSGLEAVDPAWYWTRSDSDQDRPN